MAPNNKPQPWHLRTADELNDLAEWADDEVAGGQPPKNVIRLVGIQLRYLAAKLRVEGGRR